MIVHEGGGIVNSLINKLPFELHMPGGYQFCGPGTRLEKRLRRGDPGINGLDRACREHDIAYARHPDDLEARHRADAVLAEKAWQRFRASDSKLGERSAALIVTSAMKMKRKLGAGARPDRTAKKISFGKVIKRTAELLKEAIAFKNAKDASKIAVAAAKKVVKELGGKERVNIPRVIPIAKYGGFLPALFGGLAALGSLIGGASAVAKTVNDARIARKRLEEMKRHNMEMKTQKLGGGLYLAKRKSGLGLYLNKKPKN